MSFITHEPHAVWFTNNTEIVCGQTNIFMQTVFILRKQTFKEQNLSMCAVRCQHLMHSSLVLVFLILPKTVSMTTNGLTNIFLVIYRNDYYIESESMSSSMLILKGHDFLYTYMYVTAHILPAADWQYVFKSYIQL